MRDESDPWCAREMPYHCGACSCILSVGLNIKGAEMALWLVPLAAAFLYLAWLAWVDDREHRPIVASSAALLAAAYLAMLVVLVADPWVALPLWWTMAAFVLVEVVVRSIHRLGVMTAVRLSPRYPVENP